MHFHAKGDQNCERTLEAQKEHSVKCPNPYKGHSLRLLSCSEPVSCKVLKFPLCSPQIYPTSHGGGIGTGVGGGVIRTSHTYTATSSSHCQPQVAPCKTGDIGKRAVISQKETCLIQYCPRTCYWYLCRELLRYRHDGLQCIQPQRRASWVRERRLKSALSQRGIAENSWETRGSSRTKRRKLGKWGTKGRSGSSSKEDGSQKSLTRVWSKKSKSVIPIKTQLFRESLGVPQLLANHSGLTEYVLEIRALHRAQSCYLKGFISVPIK